MSTTEPPPSSDRSDDRGRLASHVSTATPPRPDYRPPPSNRRRRDRYGAPSTGRSLAPSRRISGHNRIARVRLHIERDELLHQLDLVDDELWRLAHRRTALLQTLDDYREALWPVVPDRKGRRPRAFDAPPIPPEQPDATRLWGRSLRSACLGILGRLGRTPLIELHAWLHHYGYLIDSDHPVKALADAMGYEARAGRVVRCQRGVYDLAPDFRPRRGRHGRELPLVDPPVAHDPTEWAYRPGFFEPTDVSSGSADSHREPEDPHDAPPEAIPQGSVAAGGQATDPVPALHPRRAVPWAPSGPGWPVHLGGPIGARSANPPCAADRRPREEPSDLPASVDKSEQPRRAAPP